MYSQDAEQNPDAAADRQLLDRLEADVAAREAHLTEPAVRPRPEPDGDGVSPPSAHRARPSHRATTVLVAATVTLIAGAGVAAWLSDAAPPSAEALEVFDRLETPADIYPFSSDFLLAGGVQIDRLHSLGRFGGWDTWASAMVDGQICMIARHDTTTASTCAPRDEFALTGLTLRVKGMDSVASNAAPQRDLTITWGPDDEEATSADGPP